MKKATREEIYNKYNGHCAYCGKKLKFRELAVDHIYPKYLGGTDCISNYNPSCKSCNHYKDTMTVERFREHMGTLYDRLLKTSIVNIAIRYGMIRLTRFSGKFYFEREKDGPYHLAEDNDYVIKKCEESYALGLQRGFSDGLAFSYQTEDEDKQPVLPKDTQSPWRPVDNHGATPV